MAAINFGTGDGLIISNEKILDDVDKALANPSSSQELLKNLCLTVLERLGANPGNANFRNAVFHLIYKITDQKFLNRINNAAQAAQNALNNNQ